MLVSTTVNILRVRQSTGEMTFFIESATGVSSHPSCSGNFSRGVAFSEREFNEYHSTCDLALQVSFNEAIK